MNITWEDEIIVEGTAAPGFERVKDRFVEDMNCLAEISAQLCIYVGSEKVIDLIAYRQADDFSPDSLVNVFSSGKSLEAIALASLVSRGLLDYHSPIAEYWPEFAGNDKGTLTVADLMRHEAGLAAFDVSLSPEDLFTENIKQNAVGRIIEQHPARYPRVANRRREYHAITRGWIANELFRRVDPAGRTIGEFLREDISSPLAADTIIGVREAELARISPFVLLPFGYHLRQSIKPRFLGRRVKDNFFVTAGKLLPLILGARHRSTAGAPPPFKGMDSIGFFNESVIRKGETPSANAHSSARGLARIAAMMASGGTFEGQEFISAEAWQAMHDHPVTGSMGFETTFTQGGAALFSDQAGTSMLERAANQGRDGFYGWMGLGGSIFQWNPEYRIGFAFVPTCLHVLDLVNERGKVYQQEVLDCVEKMSRKLSDRHEEALA